MNKRKLLLSLPCGFLVLCLGAITANAAAVTFDGIGAGNTAVAYNDASNWDPAAVGTVNDDATVTGRFIINDGGDYELNSYTESGIGSFIQNGTLTVTGDIQFNTNMEVQGGGDFTWGGEATVGNGSGANDFLGASYGGTPGYRVHGDDLTVAANGFLRFRMFDMTNYAGLSTPLWDMSGTVTFDAGSEIVINLEDAQENNAIPEGSYFLLSSSNMSGLPTLNLVDFTAEQQNGFQLRVINNGLYLTNALPEPSTLGLLGVGVLVMRCSRRRRMLVAA